MIRNKVDPIKYDKTAEVEAPEDKFEPHNLAQLSLDENVKVHFIDNEE